MAVSSCVGCGVPFVPQATETICALCVAEVRAGDRRTDLTNSMVQTNHLPPPPVIIEAPPRRRDSSRRHAAQLEEADDADEMVECPMCAEEIKARARLCKHCGSDVTRKAGLRARRRGDHLPPVNVVSPVAAALFSFIFPGLGQIYAGYPQRALFFIAGTILGGFVLVVPGLLVWLVSIVDAHQCAVDTNMNASALSGRMSGRRGGSPSGAGTVAMILLAVVLVGLALLILMARRRY